MVEQDHSELTKDEAEQYDRQIRLWGLESQKRLDFTFLSKNLFIFITFFFKIAKLEDSHCWHQRFGC